MPRGWLLASRAQRGQVAEFFVGLSLRSFRGAFRNAALLGLLLALLAGASGCRTTEEKVLEQTLAVYSEAYSVLEQHADKPNEGIDAIRKFEEDSRDRRATLKKEMDAALAKLSDEERAAFQEEAKKRIEPLKTQFTAIVKRYPDDRRRYVQQIVRQIWLK